MTDQIRDLLARKEIIIGDGAFGTMIQAAGLPAGMMPEAWNVENPDAIRAVHAAYLDAGAQYLTTNTFGANTPRLKDGGLEGQVAEMNRLGAQLAKEVAGDRAWVAGSVGPTGQLMDPFGPLTIDLAEEIFAAQVVALAEGGADLFVIETHHDIEEATAAVRMARKHTDLPIFCTFAFNKRGRTMMGLKPAVAAKRVADAGGDVVGANCGDGPEAVAAALVQLKESSTLPLLAKANAGIPSMGGGETIWDVTAEQMAAEAKHFVELGATVIGGCCGTTPEFIRAIVQTIR